MSTLKSFLSILLISQTIHARSFNPCELEYELSNIYNLTTDESRNLTCVAQKYSQLTTNIINNGSKTIYYGIFQIGQKWCDIDKPGGKCNIKCEDLVDDDITDDIKCAQILFQKLGKKAWKLNKNSGCKKEFNYLDENCHKNANIDDTFQVQPDFCELARKLMTLYDISKIDATIWSCISEYSKTGNLNLRAKEEDGRDDEESCVKARDVECAIKHNKQTGSSGFTNWPEYELYCKNITESTCFESTKSVNRSEIIEQIKNVQNAETSKQPKIFTTSTEVSVFIEDDDGNLTHYSDTDITSESPKERHQTTEFLSDTLEKPSYDDKPTIEGYSKVRIMSPDKNIVELPEALETTSKSFDEVMLIISSLAMSTSAELSHTKHTTEQIHLKYYETIDKCALAKNMNDSGQIPQNLISTFICIAEHESGLNVSFIDSDGQQSRYGLFQIDNQIYCNTNDNINQCNVLCAHLVDDQFDNDFECVRHIYKKEGLNYWPSYEKSCKNINSHSLDYCVEQFTSSQRPPVPHREAENYSTEGTLEATLNKSTHMEMTTLINDVELAPSDGSLDFCEFSHQLKVNLSIGIWEDLVHYVCIADQISHLKPKLLNDDRLGIFGLKDNTCGKYQAGGLCTILCSSLLNDDLIDDAECMIKVYKEHGLNEWNIDKNSCKPYTPKILNCIDEGKFSVPSDDEIDDKEDLSIGSNYKDADIQKIIAEITQMILSRANIGNKSVENLNQTTMSPIETTSFKQDTTIKSEIQITTKKHIQNEEDLENEKQVTTEADKLDSSEKYQEEEEEEPEVAMKNILHLDTSEESESTTFEPKNYKIDQNFSIKYDDVESNEKNEKVIVELNLLTITTESLLDTEVLDKDLKSKEDDTPETTVKIDEATQEILNALKMADKIYETESSDDMELTTMSVRKPEESTIDSKDQENNENGQVSNIEHDLKGVESSTEEEDQTFLEITTESAIYQEIDDQTAVRNETEDPKRHQQNEDQHNIESETPKPENSSISDNYSNIESEIIKSKNNQAKVSYENITDETTEVEKLQNEPFSENIEKSLKEEKTTDIPLSFDDKTENTEPEILSSDSLLKNTEDSTEEEGTSPNVLNIEPIPTESNESFSENTEKYIQNESTTENELISRTQEQIYLKSTTESSLSSNILDVTENLHEFMRKLDDQTTESDEKDETELEESTVATTKSDDDSDIVLTTEETYPQPTTESLYYTSIREIIEEYQKSNVKNLDNIQSKRNQNYSDEETTVDDLFEDYDDYSDDLGRVNQSIESLNQHTTLLTSVKTSQYSNINKCQLARYMNYSGFPENLISTLICIAEQESELNPLAVKISKAHKKFGLFQIDDNIYCSTDEEIKECEFPCALLTDNQFDNDFECVRHIYKKEGFNYWPSYEKSCKNVIPDALDYCYEESHRPELEENEKLNNFHLTTLEMSQMEDIPVTSDSPNINLDTLSTDNESKSIIRKFDLCELTRELYSRNISIDDIPQYLCIADIKSDLKIKIPNVNDQSYGLFFIYSEFCGQSESGGICSMKCSELWDSNISDDVDCVHKIIETNGTDKWNLNSKVCQIYDNKFLECFDKTTELPKMSEIDFDGVSRHDVITESEKMTDMISDMTDKNLEDLRQETSNLRSSNADIESDEMTIVESTAHRLLPLEQTTSKIIQILTSTASTDYYDSTTENVDKQIKRVPLVEINLPREILNDQNLSKQVGTLIKNFTYFDVLPNNRSIIFNIFNFNIYGENHDVEYTINTRTDHKDRVGD